MNAPDRVDAAQQALVQVLTNPVTWLPFVPIAAAYAFVGLTWWLCLPLALAVLTMVCVMWSRRWPRLTERARTGLLQGYRAAENAELYGRLRDLATTLAHLPTKRLLYDLREAMELKQAVEKRLFADGIITPHEEEVNEMVADTVRNMVGEAEKVPHVEGAQGGPRAAAKVEKALESLRRVFEQIDVILDPVPEDLRLPAETDSLSRASERLNERLEQAQGVRRHLERGMIVHDEQAPPDLPVPVNPISKQPATE